MATRKPLILKDNAAQELPAGDTLPPTSLPRSEAPGNKLQVLSSGLYSGNSINATNTLYVSAAGNDSSTGDTAALAKKTIGSALDRITQLAANLLDFKEATILLRAGDTFDLTKDYTLPYKLNIAFYGSNRGDYNAVVDKTRAFLIKDATFPSINAKVYKNAANLNNCAGFVNSDVTLYGVKINLPSDEFANNTYGEVDFFKRGCTVDLQGATLNMPLVGVYGFVGVTPCCTTKLKAYASQILVDNKRVDANNSTPQFLQRRQRAIKFYLAPAPNAYDVYYLNPTGATSSNGSGMLEVFWIDSEELGVAGNLASKSSYPKQTLNNLGLRHYITGMTLGAGGNPLNVKSGREI